MGSSELNTVTTVDYMVIVTYLLALVWIGKFFARYNKNIGDFFKGGSKLPWWVGGISSFMAGFSAWMFTGGAGVVYERGPIGILAICGGMIGTLFGWMIFAKRWRRSRVTSMFEYVSTRFNLPTQQALSWTFLPMNLFYCSAVLLSTSIFITAALGINEINLTQLGIPWDLTLNAMQVAIVVAGMIILTYCYFGGLLAVTSADVLSFLIIIPLAVLIVPLILLKVGSVPQVFTTPQGFTVPEGKSIMSEPINLAFVMMLLISNTHGYNSNPIVQRYWSVKDENAARKVALLCTVLFFFGLAVWSIPPLAVRHLFPDLSQVWTSLNAPAEGAYVSACLSVLPHGLVGIMFAAIFAASMSSIDSTLNFISGIFTNDIYRKVMKKGANAEHMLKVGRFSTLGIGVTAIILALLMSTRGGAFSWMVWMDKIFTTPIVVPLLMGLFFPKRGSMAGLTAFTVTFVFNIFFSSVIKLEYSTLMYCSFALAYVTFFVSALLIPDNDTKKDEIRRFFKMLNTPVQVDSELTEVAIDKLSMLGFIGKMASATGLAMSSMVLIPQPLPERLKVLLGGAVVLALGLLMIWGDRRQRRIYEQQQAALHGE